MKHTKNKSITTKLILWITTIFFVLTSLAVVLLGLREYQNKVDGVHRTFHEIEASFGEPLANALWSFNEAQVRLILQGINATEAIDLVILKTKDMGAYEYGNSVLDPSDSFHHDIELVYGKRIVGNLHFYKNKSKILNEVAYESFTFAIIEMCIIFILLMAVFFFLKKQVIEPVNSFEGHLSQ